MTHKTDMREALQLCIDAMLHDGVPTDPYHPRCVALAAAEDALAGQSTGAPDEPKRGTDAQADERGAFEHAFAMARGGERHHQWYRSELKGYWNGEGYDNLAYDAAWIAWKARAAAPQPSPLNGIPATLRHDEGAIARCSYCGRYSIDPRTLSDRQPACECGERHGWSGSFEKPGRDAKWSGSVPTTAPQAEAAQGVPDDVRAAVERMCSPLHESRLSGVTAQEDARCMKLIRDYVLGTDAAPSPDREQVGEAPRDLAKTFKQWVRDHEAELNSREYSRIDRALDQFIMDLALRNASPSRDCPHGVDDGACKQCYGEAVSGEQGALRGSCPDGRVCEIGCFGECEKRAAASAPTLGGPEFNTPTIPFEEAMKYAVQPQAAEPKGLTVQDMRLLAMRYAANYTEFDDGSLHTIDFGEYGFANFARALLAQGE